MSVYTTGLARAAAVAISDWTTENKMSNLSLNRAKGNWETENNDCIHSKKSSEQHKNLRHLSLRFYVIEMQKDISYVW